MFTSSVWWYFVVGWLHGLVGSCDVFILAPIFQTVTLNTFSFVSWTGCRAFRREVLCCDIRDNLLPFEDFEKVECVCASACVCVYVETAFLPLLSYGELSLLSCVCDLLGLNSSFAFFSFVFFFCSLGLLITLIYILFVPSFKLASLYYPNSMFAFKKEYTTEEKGNVC